MPGLPAPSSDWAMFLDIDGTLVEFAPRPELVRATPELVRQLERLRDALGGALAIVSGRSIASIDDVLATSRFAAAGEHGVERRDAMGTLRRRGTRMPSLDAAHAMLVTACARHDGLILEDKDHSLALHYRLAPSLSHVAGAAMRTAATIAGEQYDIVAGACVVELRPRGVDKGSAIVDFMKEPPFAGRCPVFIGDDRTDEDGFCAVDMMGGHAIKVGLAATRASCRIANVAGVREWISYVTQQLAYSKPSAGRIHERAATKG